MQRVDEQGDQQDQADHDALNQSHFALDLPVLGPHHGLQPGDSLLHIGDFQVCCRAEVGALLDLITSACEFGRVAGEQAVEFAFESDAGIFGSGFFGVLQTHHRGEIIGVRFAAGCYAEQRQGVQLFRLSANVDDFAFDIGGQLTATAADQLVPGQRQLAQMLRGGQQWRQVGRVAAGVLVELIKVGAEFPFSLQQQRLWVAGELAGRQQVVFAELTQVRQARTQGLGQCRRQLIEFFLNALNGLAGAAQAQGIAAAEIILNAARDFILEGLRQAQVALH
ncbi:hypothetical protein D3C81_1299360 [compost metagenome]